MPRHLFSYWIAAAACSAVLATATAQEAKPKPNQTEQTKIVLPDFPRINTAPWYEVDKTWPQRPAQYDTAAVPGIAVDAKDQIWVFTRTQPFVQIYAADGKLIRAWGTDPLTNAHHIKIDQDGNVWLADIGLHVVRKFSPGGEILLTIGTAGQKGTDKAHLNAPTDMAITATGEVFVADGYGNNRVVHFDAKGKYVKEWGQLGVGPNDFSLPHAIGIDSKGVLYIADRNNQRVQVYNQAGKLLDSWQNVIVPWGITITAKDEIWVAGCSPMPWLSDPKYPGAPLSCPPKDQLVMKFNTQGKVLQLTTFPKGADEKEQPGDVNWLHTAAVDSAGNLYLGDIIGKRAQKFVRQK
jgi:DNA-binding beta-propeller fold protein YncE